MRYLAVIPLALALIAPSETRADDDRLVAVRWGEAHKVTGFWSGGGGDLVEIARRHIDKRARDLSLPRSLWCGDFTNLVRREAGLPPVPSRLARDQVKGGTRIAAPKVGAIVVLSRGRSRSAGHTGIVSGVTPDGDPVVISGNHGGKVAEAVYPKSRVVAFVDPRE